MSDELRERLVDYFGLLSTVDDVAAAVIDRFTDLIAAHQRREALFHKLAALDPPAPRDAYHATRTPMLVVEMEAPDPPVPHEWQPIATAPIDGTLILVYASGVEGLPSITCPCAYHPDAGFCVDELREPTHWMPLQPAPDQGGER